MQLNNANYHSLEADAEYMSVHQFQSWCRCAAREAARQRGEYVPAKEDALVEGQYFHTALLQPELLPAWLEENADAVLSKSGPTKGKPKAGFVVIDRMIARLRRELVWNDFMELSDKEQVITPVLGGVAWKMQIDFIAHSVKAFGDLKSAKDFEWSYNSEYKVRTPWYEGYWLQLGMYRAGIRAVFGFDYSPCIIGATKQDPPDICAVDFEDHGRRLSAEVEMCLLKLPEVMAWKTGLVTPQECGKCDYCRERKVLTFFPAENVVNKVV